MTYRLNARGAEVLGDNPGAILTIADVESAYETILGESMSDVEVAGDGLYLLGEDGQREMIAEVVESMPVDRP